MEDGERSVGGGLDIIEDLFAFVIGDMQVVVKGFFKPHIGGKLGKADGGDGVCRKCLFPAHIAAVGLIYLPVPFGYGKGSHAEGKTAEYEDACCDEGDFCRFFHEFSASLAEFLPINQDFMPRRRPPVSFISPLAAYFAG